MQVRAATSSDIAAMQRWLARHNHEAVSISDLPTRFYAVPGVAVGGLFVEEGRAFAMIDSICTNPLASSKARHAAYSSLISHITHLASSLGVRRLIGFSNDTGTLMRARSYGFTSPNLAILAKRIS